VEVVSRGMVLTLDEGEATTLARQLAETMRLAYVARDRTPPRFLLDFANDISRAARGFAQVRVNAQVGAPGELSEVRGGPFPSSLAQPVWLTAAEAARIAEVSVQTMRRYLSGGDPHGSRGGRRSAWRVDASELAAWLSRRRAEIAQKAA